MSNKPERRPTYTYSTPDLYSTSMPLGFISVNGGKGKKHVAAHYADIADVPFSVKKPAGAWDGTAWGNSEPTWYGATPAETKKLITEGWSEGAARAAAIRGRIEAERPATAKLARWDVVGAYPSVGRYLAGNPANMRRLSSVNRPRVLSLSVSGGLSARVDSSDIESHAASAAAIVDMLESADYRVELFWVWRALGPDLSTEIAVCIKQADQPVNLATLAFLIGHPAMLRRVGFAIAAHHPWQGLSSSMGVPIELEADAERGAYVIPSAQKTKAGSDAVKAFDAQIADLRKQGCPGLAGDGRDDQPEQEAA